MDVDIAVIGGGPAGLAAALAAAKGAPGGERPSVLILERDKALGGILRQCIHNGFGLHYFKQELTGPEYAQRFIDMLEGTGIEAYTDTMVLSLSNERVITAVSAQRGLTTVRAKAVVLAMGCRERTRGALNIAGSRPAGIYTAGAAQRLVNMEGYMPGRRVVVLGSGDIGLIMARRMTWEGAKVEMVCELMPYSSGLTRNIVQCLEDNDIPLLFSTTVTRVHGRERVEGVTIASVDARRRPIPSTERYVPCDTLLLSVGLIPENELSAEAGVAMDAMTGGAIVDQGRETSVPGVFACGNVLHVHDLVDYVSDEAAIAGASAAAFARGAYARAVERRVLPGAGVRYAVPQRITGEGRHAVYFRVADVVKPARVSVAMGGKEVWSRRKNIATPGEMERIEIDTALVAGDITVSVEAYKAGGE